MLIFLPPSEGKTAGGRGAPVDVDALTSPALAAARREVGETLVRLAAGEDRAHARSVLRITAGQDAELDVDAALFTAPARPAAALYTGVLYDALSMSTLDAAAKRRASAAVRIFSAVWGPVRPRDRIPPYRCAMGVSLPGLGPLASFWRARLDGVLTEEIGDRVVLDLRSSAYAAAWRPDPVTASRVVALRVLHERTVHGEPVRSVVSHFNKATKGRIVRDLLIADVRPRKPDDLLDALRDLGYRVEGGGGGRADVIVTEL